MTAGSDPLGLSRSDWEERMTAWGLPAFRGRQVFDAIHGRGSRSMAGIHEVPRDLRERLEREMPIVLPEIVRREPSRDGSVKYGMRLADGALVEAVYMPGDPRAAEVNEFTDARAVATVEAAASPPPEAPAGPAQRYTVCLSSQTGCAVDCAFCVTGRLGGGRNLSAGEIVGELYAVLADAGRTPEGLRVVFMGMGEPFLNPDGVLPALAVLFEIIPPRRVTVSTSGITPAFERFAALPRRPNLAVSLNAADDETRSAIMPINRTYPLDGLLRAIAAWPLEARRRITIEYVAIAGRNDRTEDAKRLARILRGLNVKVNVIPLNEDPVYLPGWRRPDDAVIERFAGTLVDAGVPVTVRRSRGPDASAACGQLKGRTEDPRKRVPGPRT
ncbi:MAG: 23S rRNA (adenine(2503)-C(2))-methyltransferase RlmN [Acidobacteriota bacterium]|nr:23S rRNA (adenine(2503)-C(2))-methyltransferase RlmN [Acidobacteriota bacterium]